LTRKLTLLNLLLVALLGAAGWQLRERWEEARIKQEAQLKRTASVPAPPTVPVVETVKPVEAANYADVATKMMFSKDRNPTVVIEAAPPPPEDPIPTFPAVYGVMDIGGPITVFMSDGTSSAQKGYRSGDRVGPFKLVSATRNEFVLSWKDKTFTKTLADLKPKPGQEQSAPSSAAAVPQAPQVVPLARPTVGGTAADEKIKAAQKDMIKDGIMIDTGAVNRACVPGDTSPSGTVQAGYRKVMRASMFGQACYWEPAR
jgi:hypothetical protein